MGKINLNKIIYKLTVEDLQKVASETLERELTESEILLIEEKIDNNIDWYTAIANTIDQHIIK